MMKRWRLIAFQKLPIFMILSQMTLFRLLNKKMLTKLTRGLILLIRPCSRFCKSNDSRAITRLGNRLVLMKHLLSFSWQAQIEHSDCIKLTMITWNRTRSPYFSSMNSKMSLIRESGWTLVSSNLVLTSDWSRRDKILSVGSRVIINTFKKLIPR